MGPTSELLTLDAAFNHNVVKVRRRHFPVLTLINYVYRNPRLIVPGTKLSIEIILSFFKSLFREVKR